MKFIDIRSKHHGYDIKLDDSLLKKDEQNISLIEYNKKYGRAKWVYCDTLEVLSNSRPCKHCGLEFKKIKGSVVDPCYGYLKGVSGACCGHGDQNRQYINMSDGNGHQLTFKEYNEKKTHYRFKKIDNWPFDYTYKIKVLKYRWWIFEIWSTVYTYVLTDCDQWQKMGNVLEKIYLEKFYLEGKTTFNKFFSL